MWEVVSVSSDLSSSRSLFSDDFAFASLGGANRDFAYMETEREIRTLQVLQASRIATVDASMSYADDQYANTANWLCAVTNTSKATAQREVQMARMMAGSPKVAVAAAAGQLGSEQLRIFANLFANDFCRDRLPWFVDVLIDSARTFVLHDFRAIADRFKLNADPDGAHREHVVSREKRHVSGGRIGEKGFRHVVEGDALTGETINTIIKAHAEAEYHADIAARLTVHGDDAAAYPLRRTHAQRMYDALYGICLKASSVTEVNSPNFLIVMHSTPATLKLALEMILADVAGRHIGPDDLMQSTGLLMSETASGAPVDLLDLARAALMGQLQHILSDESGVTINLGRKSRLFRGSAKDAVLFSGDRCNGPGCHCRFEDIQIDHSKPWSRSGLTNQDNGGPKCKKCNLAKEAGKFTVVRDETGWHHFRPDGSEIAPRGPP
jgi:hypothetical protein